MSVTKVLIPVNPDNPFPLGRHVEHDDRSRRFSLAPTPQENWRDREWLRYIPILDQSNLLRQGIELAERPDALNSCTGNAGIGAVGSAPFWRKQPVSLRRVLKNSTTAEIHAIDLYASATELDEFPDTYPPQDQGSSGLAVAKALVNLGFISSYEHVFSGVTGMVTALQDGPALLGVNWYESMFTPKSNGTVEIAGAVVGGHEIVADAVFIKQRLFRCPNSWGTGWGDDGCFFLSFDQVDRLLGEQGDLVVPRITA